MFDIKDVFRVCFVVLLCGIAGGAGAIISGDYAYGASLILTCVIGVFAVILAYKYEVEGRRCKKSELLFSFISSIAIMSGSIMFMVLGMYIPSAIVFLYGAYIAVGVIIAYKRETGQKSGQLEERK